MRQKIIYASRGLVRLAAWRNRACHDVFTRRLCRLCAVDYYYNFIIKAGFNARFNRALRDCHSVFAVRRLDADFDYSQFFRHDDFKPFPVISDGVARHSPFADYRRRTGR